MVTPTPDSHALSAAEVRQYHENGVLGPFDLWRPEETPRLRAALERHYLGTGSVGEAAAKTSFARDPALVELARRSELTGRVASILGEDLFLWRARPFLKPPRSGRDSIVPWHQDRYALPLEPMVACSAWLAVDDVDADNGAMSVIPGSHRELVPHVPAEPGQMFEEQAHPDWVDASRARPIELRAGQFVLFSDRLLHRSDPNRSRRRRFGLALRILPPLVRVLEYDDPAHALVQIRGRDPLGFNRLAELPAVEAA